MLKGRTEVDKICRLDLHGDKQAKVHPVVNQTRGRVHHLIEDTSGVVEREVLLKFCDWK